MIEWTMDGKVIKKRALIPWITKRGDRKYVKLSIRNVHTRPFVNLTVVARGPRSYMADFKFGFFDRADWAYELPLGTVKPGEIRSFILRLISSGFEGETPKITVEER